MDKSTDKKSLKVQLLKTMSEIVIYKSDTNQIEVSVQLDKDTVWLNRNQLAELYDRAVSYTHLAKLKS